ncbi:TlpA family protein disulfide reductase [Krasilnikovia sp. MM14-A1004]|uniref:TlpA family protein disulfide reductase n=1 Tax=Krasilnikovia sp. MM14-A1004 TaxID=3373541 RepID=UPI00399CFF24
MTVRGRARGARRLAVSLAPMLATSLALTACTASERSAPPPGQPSPFVDCAALTAPPPSAAASAAGAAAGGQEAGGSGAGAALPDLELPCFTGGAPVRLAGLRGPAVVNLWASWCEPCRTELPAMQRLAAQSAGTLTVVGVDTGDDRDAAAGFATDKRVTMPTLYDRDRKLITALGRTTLPVTVFVDARGRSHVEPLPLTEESLAARVRDWTGVTVAP